MDGSVVIHRKRKNNCRRKNKGREREKCSKVVGGINTLPETAKVIEIRVCMNSDCAFGRVD